MFCTSCGCQLLDGAVFCSNCGTPQNGMIPILQSQQSFMVQGQILERQSGLAEIDRMLNYFGPKQDMYNQYYKLARSIQSDSRVKLVPLLVIGIYIICIAMMGMSFNYRSAADIVIGIVVIIHGIAMIIAYIMANSARKNRLPRSKEEFQYISDELIQHYMNYGPCLLGIEYTNPSFLWDIKNLILSGRAYSVKEAINTMNVDANFARLQMLAKQAADASRRAANNAGLAAGISVINYFR